MTLGTGFLAVMLREGKGGVEASYPEQGLLGEGVNPGYTLSTEIPSKVGLPVWETGRVSDDESRWPVGSQ